MPEYIAYLQANNGTISRPTRSCFQWVAELAFRALLSEGHDKNHYNIVLAKIIPGSNEFEILADANKEDLICDSPLDLQRHWKRTDVQKLLPWCRRKTCANCGDIIPEDKRKRSDTCSPRCSTMLMLKKKKEPVKKNTKKPKKRA